jgi:glycosyltransferase involved in cell wall biosynthesis
MPSTEPRRRLAIAWTNFGPYHLARIRALMGDFDVQAIELANFQRMYRWGKAETDLQIHTLREGAWEDQGRIGMALELWRKLSRLRPSVVLVPGYFELPALCAALWGRTHRAVTLCMSESNFDDHRRRRLAETLKRLILRLLFDGGVVGGKRAASYLERLGMPAERIGRAYDVVDNEYFASQAAQCRCEVQDCGEAKPSPYFLFVGRLAPEKNVSTLLDAFGQYRDSGGAWPLVIAGDGPLRGVLREQAEARGLTGNVVFAGHKRYDELPPLYASAGCFVLPSTREPWGLVVNEAMACGLPVIVSSRCGCADDLVEEGLNGFVVDPKSALEIAAAMARISNLSAEERGRMGERSRTIVAEYSPGRWASEVRRIVEAAGS